MAAAIKALDYTFNAQRLLDELNLKKAELHQEDSTQFLITHRPGDVSPDRWIHGAGLLWSEEQKKYWAATSAFSHLDESLRGTIVEDTVAIVRAVARTYTKRIGRVRLLTLKPKTCYSLHNDAEEFRFHIPLQTSWKSFFVCDNVIERMPEVGRLYTFRADTEHTAVNASFEYRHHLVFDTWG